MIRLNNNYFDLDQAFKYVQAKSTSTQTKSDPNDRSACNNVVRICVYNTYYVAFII